MNQQTKLKELVIEHRFSTLEYFTRRLNLEKKRHIQSDGVLGEDILKGWGFNINSTGPDFDDNIEIKWMNFYKPCGSYPSFGYQKELNERAQGVPFEQSSYYKKIQDPRIVATYRESKDKNLGILADVYYLNPETKIRYFEYQKWMWTEIYETTAEYLSPNWRFLIYLKEDRIQLSQNGVKEFFISEIDGNEWHEQEKLYKKNYDLQYGTYDHQLKCRNYFFVPK